MNKTVTYYVNTIFVLVLLQVTMAIASEDDVHILATALYGIDTQGRHFFIAGPLPSTFEDVIKSDMQSRMNPKPIVKVVTFFQNINRLPLNDDDSEKILLEFKSYTNVLKANFSKVESRKMLKNLWYYNVEERKRHIRPKEKTDRTHEQQTSEETEQLKNNPGSITAVNKTSSPDDYIPNDIYYAVEKKCTNWADGCDTKSLPFLDMSSTYFKLPLGYRQKPQKLNWSR